MQCAAVHPAGRDAGWYCDPWSYAYGDPNVEEPARLVCPQCDLVYRLKRLTPGKTYTCKSCGGVLTSAGGDVSVSTHDRRTAASDRYAPLRESRPAPESDLSRLPRLIEDLTLRLDILKSLELGDETGGPVAKLMETTGRLEENLREIGSGVNKKLEELDENVAEAVKDDSHIFHDKLLRRLDEVEDKLQERFLVRFGEVEGRLAVMADKTVDPEILSVLRQEVRDSRESFQNIMMGLRKQGETQKAELSSALVGLQQQGEAQKSEFAGTLARIQEKTEAQKTELASLLERIQEKGEAQKSELSQALLQLREKDEALKTELAAILSLIQEKNDAQKAELALAVEGLRENAERRNEELVTLLTPDPEQPPPTTTLEVDIDELADRLVAGVRGNGSLLDAETGKVVDALAKLADELVREQSANTVRLDHLATEIHQATTHIAKLDEWRGDLPDKVADEIGATVEARVVGPIAGALSRQAPAILSELQDSKMVDIVSRSVREAQRPLLREILTNGRAGLPWWSFMALLIPLLLILGYLFLPSFFISEDGTVHQELSDTRKELNEGQTFIIEKLAQLGDGDEIGERLSGMEAMLKNIRDEAMVHAQNNARLEEEVKSLRAGMAAQDKALEEYKSVVVKQDGRLRQYERRLTQLGVSPASLGD